MIKSFAADSAKLIPGEQTKLRFTTENATEVEIVDQRGERVAITGDVPNEGEAVVIPAVTSFYVLRAKGDGGIDTAFVQVAVGEPLKDLFLVAVPADIDPGEPVQLVWSAFNAVTGRIQASTGQRYVLDAEAGSGVIEVAPDQTTQYQLIAAQFDVTAPLTAETEVRVRPKLDAVYADPPAARVGETITFHWKTRSAAEVSLEEPSFGELFRYAGAESATDVAAGSFSWTVPATTKSGTEVLEGRPLFFTFTAKQTNPAITLTRKIDSYVGLPTRIVDFSAPPAVTHGRTFEITWRTQNATRVQLYANGGLIFEPMAKDAVLIPFGRLTLEAPVVDTTFELRAYGPGNTVLSATRFVQAVKAPKIETFTVGSPVQKPGSAAVATWQTRDVTTLIIRVKNGPNAFFSRDASSIAQGSTQLYPGVSTTFVLEAYNDAGDFVSAEVPVQVAATPTFTATPSTLTTGEEVKVTWQADPLTTAQYIGDPTPPPVKNSPAFGWYELDGHVDAQKVVFSDPDEAVARVRTTLPFRFPFVGFTSEEVFVSTNGFVTFERGEPMPTNRQLTSQTDPLPTMIAPFWDNLKLGENGSVLSHVDGSSFPRRMIVQWNRVTNEDGATLTFQVQLFETGEFHFAYKTLSGTNSAGESASVGWRVNASLARETAIPTAPTVSPNTEVLWFGSGALDGEFTFKPHNPGVLANYARLANGRFIVYQAGANVIVPGSVVVNEVMVDPGAAATNGRWVELRNVTNRRIDVGGTVLTSLTTPTEFKVPVGTVIEPYGYLVIGDSDDPAENGGAPITVEWDTISPANNAGDTIALMAVNEISSLAYAFEQIAPGQSINAPDPAIDDTGAGLDCTRTQSYGSGGAIGTPGARNETCFSYYLDAIPLDFHDIRSTGKPIWPINQSYFYYDFTKGLNRDLSEAPFPYFSRECDANNACTHNAECLNESNQPVTGTETGTCKYTRLHVEPAGILYFGNASTQCCWGQPYYPNRTVPGTNTPSATISLFWEYIDKRQGSEGTVWMDHLTPLEDGVAKPHWIFQFSEFTYVYWYGYVPDNLNFQAKLFDDGTIEFHYAAMEYGGQSPIVDGSSSTAWIESPDGTGALPISINQPQLTSNKAWRFTPKALIGQTP